MPTRTRSLVLVVVVALVAGVASGASIASNLVEEERPRIASSEELLSSIVNECFDGASVMGCLKGKVLLYLDGMLGLREEEARAFEERNVDEVIFDRVGRVLATHEFRVQLPEDTVVSYRADKGLDIDVVPAGLATGEYCANADTHTHTHTFYTSPTLGYGTNPMPPLPHTLRSRPFVRCVSRSNRSGPWSLTEEETTASSVAAAEAEDEGADADLPRADRTEGDEGAHPVQAGDHAGARLPGCPAGEEVRPGHAHVDDAHDDAPGSGC